MNPTQNQAASVEVTPAFTLRAAATYLDRYGWTQRVYYFHPQATDDRWPAACAIGAIGMAVHGREYECPQDEDLPGGADFSAAYHALRGYLVGWGVLPDEDTEFMTIGDWNDEAEHTAEAVIGTLRAAADEWDRVHGGAA